MLRSRGHHLSVALLALTALHCAEDSGAAADTTIELAAELSGAASGITVFVRPELVVAPSGSITLFGRASKDLAAVSVSVDGQALGTVRLPSVRRFEVVVSGAADVQRLLSGAPLELGITAAVGRERAYVAQVALGARYEIVSGPRATVVEPALAPVSVGGALALRSRFRIGTSDAITRARVEVDGVGSVPLTREGTRAFRFDLAAPQVLVASDAAGDRVRFSANATKVARLRISARRVETRLATNPFTPATCADATRACLADAQGDDLELCGSFAEVQRCASVEPVGCDPLIESALSDCVYARLESVASDPDSAPITALEALEQCTAEGDLFGPLFDGVCASAPSTPGCGCFGQEDCLERFVTGPLAACRVALEPRFDCAFGLTFRDLRDSAKVVIAERRELRRADVSDALLSAQVVAAVRVARSDVTTLDQAFQAADGGVVNLLHLWEGGRSEAYTALEYGAGDNSYGALFAYGSATAVVNIQDGDLYQSGTPPVIGCRIPGGAWWRACTDTAECGELARCEGIVRTYDEATGVETVTHPGKCVPRVDAGPASGMPCGAGQACPLQDGLLCSALDASGSGSCRPTWMFGAFRFPSSLTVPARARTEYPIVVSGLATVPEQARFEAYISAPDLTRVRLTLLNPTYRTPGIVFDGPALGRAGVTALLGGTSGERRLSVLVPVPGDESVNGEWRLLVDTTAEPRSLAGDRGIVNAVLTLSSRYD